MFTFAAIKGFITSPLFKYIAIIAVVLGVLFAVYSHGKSVVQAEWDAANAIAEKEIAELKAKANQITITEVIKYVDRIETVKVKGDTVTIYVKEFITAEDDAKCTIPNNFVLFHDLAAKNMKPPPLVEGGPAK
jgi:hypothetical protein